MPVEETNWMRRARWIAWILIGMSALASSASTPARAQDPQQEPEQKPDNANAPTVKKPPAKKNSDNATQSAPDQPMWDPLRAEKDIEVGQYYMRKGDVDAAIDRFQDATIAKPGYAIPFRYLGEAQEKKGLKKPAIKSYRRYLDMVPHADDADKIRKKIEKLEKEIEKSKKQI
jgi:tetratricopeptide (TPR) repeat protein